MRPIENSPPSVCSHIRDRRPMYLRSSIAGRRSRPDQNQNAHHHTCRRYRAQSQPSDGNRKRCPRRRISNLGRHDRPYRAGDQRRPQLHERRIHCHRSQHAPTRPKRTKITLSGFRMHPNGLKHLVSKGFNVLSLANNHSMDYGVPGLKETLKHVNKLQGQGVLAANGIGLNREAASRPTVIKVKEKDIAFLRNRDRDQQPRAPPGRTEQARTDRLPLR